MYVQKDLGVKYPSKRATEEDTSVRVEYSISGYEQAIEYNLRWKQAALLQCPSLSSDNY
jgi:hypothetical protein